MITDAAQMRVHLDNAADELLAMENDDLYGDQLEAVSIARTALRGLSEALYRLDPPEAGVAKADSGTCFYIALRRIAEEL